VGYAATVTGAVLGFVGFIPQTFPLFRAGMVHFGTAQTSNLLARHAGGGSHTGCARGRALGG
jgi:hypothetical protein